MGFDLLNFAYTVGTIDVAQDITPGVAQTGFRDFSSIPASDTTYVVAVQGAKRAYMKVQKVGSILRPQTYHDGTNGEGATVTFDAGTITVFTDLGHQHIVYVDGDGNAVNAEAVLNSFSPETLADLKTKPLPASGKTVAYLRGILADDNRGQFYVWDPDETNAGDDFDYVVSSLSATGRWVRQKPIIEVPAVSADSDAYSSSLYAVNDELRHKRSDDVVKKLFTGENHHEGEFANLAEWKALASSQWSSGDTFVFRGITTENDLGGQRLTFEWNASSTNTDALDVTQLRPDDITGSNAGRAVLVEPPGMTKLPNADTTPSLSGGRFHRCADTAPAAITALDGLVDLQPHWIFPGAQAQLFTHSASLLCPGGDDFLLGVNDSPIMVVSDNNIVSIISGGLPAAYKDGGIVAASTGVITLAAHKLHTLTAGDTITGVDGLNERETAYFILPASGAAITLTDGGSPASGQAWALGGADTILTPGDDENVYAVTRVGAEVRLSGGVGGRDSDKVLADIAALRLQNLPLSTAPKTVTLKDNYSSGDGGGEFYLDEADTSTADDHGLTIVTAAGLRYVRKVPTGRIYPEFFGPTGTADDQLAFERALAADRGLVYLRGNGNYTLTDDLYLTGNGAGIIGEHGGFGRSIYTGPQINLPADKSIWFGSPSNYAINPQIGHFTVVQAAGTGYGINWYSARNARIDNVAGVVNNYIKMGEGQKTITALANNGSGAVRVTCAGHGFQSGLTVWSNATSAITGVTGALGAFVVTVIDANTFDLNGSTFGGTPYAGSDVKVRVAPHNNIGHIYGGGEILIRDHYGIDVYTQAGAIYTHGDPLRFESINLTGTLPTTTTRGLYFRRATNVYDRLDHWKTPGIGFRFFGRNIQVDNTRVVSIEIDALHSDEWGEAGFDITMNNVDYTGGGAEQVRLGFPRFGSGIDGQKNAIFMNAEQAYISEFICIGMSAACFDDAIIMQGGSSGFGFLYTTISDAQFEMRPASADRIGFKLSGALGTMHLNGHGWYQSGAGTFANMLNIAVGSTGTILYDLSAQSLSSSLVSDAAGISLSKRPLGDAGNKNIGTSGDTVPVLNGSGHTWANPQNFTANNSFGSVTRIQDRVNVADDTVHTITIGDAIASGYAHISVASSNKYAKFLFETSDPDTINEIDKSASNVVITTGDHIGTTGVDGDLTVSLHGNNIQIENRLGGTVSVLIDVLFG